MFIIVYGDKTLSKSNNKNIIYKMHSLSIPSIDRIVSHIIMVDKKVLFRFLKLARLQSNICRSFSCDIFGLINNSKYMQEPSACLLFLQI